jgi:succinate dehydrogenase / fumarate reductase membrane anchor subunit
MDNNTNKLKSPLARARGLGSAKTGTHHWWLQRLTALALVPLGIWFVATVLRMVQSTEAELFKILTSPINTMALILFLLTTLYHGMLGMRVVIEDYVHKECTKFAMIILLQFVSILTGLAVLFSVLRFHFSIFNAL